MSISKPDKRKDAVGPSPSSPLIRHHTGHKDTAWEDSGLFGETEKEVTYKDENAHDENASSPERNRKIPAARQKERRPSTSFLSDTSDGVGDGEAPTVEPERSRKPRTQRQPPLSASSFLLDADGGPNDGLLSMYCGINYSRDKLHRFKFLNRQESRDARKEEFKRELHAAQELIGVSTRREQRNPRALDTQSDQYQRHQNQQEALRASIIVKSRKRQLARLAAEERVDLRDDLNTLLSEIREGLVACYPYNEHLSRLSRRLDKISTHPALWARYRTRLVQLHTTGFLRKWEDAGCPPHPVQLLRPRQSESQPETGHLNCNPEAPSTEYMEAPFYSCEATSETEKGSSDRRFERGESQQHAGEGTSEAAVQEELQPGVSEGPSAEELEELRLKQREARARREKMRAAHQKQQ